MKQTKLLLVFFAMFVFGQTAWAQFNSGSGTSESMAANSEKGYVASVDNGSTVTYYNNFSDALSNWGNNCTLKLLADVEISSTINVSNTRTLDLNGFGIKMLSSIYGGAESPGSVFLLNTAGAYLTIRDSNPTTTHYYTIASAATNGAGLAKVVDQAIYNSASGTKGTFLGGYITGGRNTASNAYGAGVHLIGNNCRLDIYGGTIIGNELTGNTTGGGGVQIEGSYNNAKFYMYGGNIIGNRAAYGGAVYIRSGLAEFHDGLMKYNIAHQTCGGAVHAYGDHSTFVMSGGTLSNNKAACGGALEASGSGTITLTGGSIVDNLATERGGALTNRRVNDDTHNAVFNLSGNVLISGNTRNSNAEQIFLSNTVKLRITGALSNTTSIGVSMTTPGVFTTGYNSYNSTTHPSAYFHSEMAGYTIKLTAAGEVSMASPASLTAAPTAITGLFYTGAAQALVNAGTATGGTMKYSLNNSTWSTVIPTATDAGSYTVYYKVEGDDIHTDFIPSPNTLLVTISDFQGSGTVGDPYLIPSTAVWNHLAANVTAGNQYTGVYFRQTENISVTQPIGNFVDNQPTNQKPFSGTYNGDGHTLNVNINTTGSFLGPFRCLNDATIKNLVVTGSVTAHARHASGLVGTLMGPCTIENCLVSTNVSGIDYMGGVIGHCRLDNFTIVGCVFNGTLTASGDGYTGGFNGWGGEPQTTEATITNCFFAGTYVNSSGGKFHPVGCFGGANATRTISNVYYTKALVNMTNEDKLSIVKNPVTYKGEFAYSVTAGTGVTVAPAGTPTATYDVSGLDFYGENGFAFNGVLYGGNEDMVSLNLTHADAPTGYSFYDYKSDHGTVTGSGNPYSLTMPAADATINARYSTIKSIDAYTSNANGWYLISSPFELVTPSSENGFITNTYDLFRFNQNPSATTTAQGTVYLELENWDDHEPGGSEPRHFNLEPGRGYLYANSNTVNLTFIGTPYNGTGVVNLEYSTTNPDSRMHGWNLVGNPFGVTATINKGFYRMNGNHTEVIAAQDNNIAPMEGIFVHADNNSETVTFNTGAKRETADIEDRIVINLSGNDGVVIDRAIVSFDEDRTLPKFQISDYSTKLYIPQNGKDYAIAYSDGHGEMPISFKAATNSSYILTVDAKGTAVAYLHLIDNIAGADIDLLAQPSYTFTAQTTDYASRFKLVFGGHGNADENENFAFVDGNGQLIVNGTGTVRVIDIMGRVIGTCSADERISTNGMTAGVYVLQLITGTETKIQKIVVK